MRVGWTALRIAERTKCSVVGVDMHADAVNTARSLAGQQGLNGRARFEVADATKALPFANASFDAITCIDAINHLPDRPRIIGEWARLLKPGGRLLFTDPIIITGPLSGEELAVRSSIGFFLFVPAVNDEQVIKHCGLQLLVREDATANMARIAKGRAAARAARGEALRGIEGDASYGAQQAFFEVAARIAREKRLSWFLFVAEKRG